jgi:biopolymer transport protein ExbD
MGFRSGRQRGGHSQMPEVNLVPMMDVVLTILTFFILVTMTMRSGGGESAAVELELPSAKEGVSVASPNPSAKPVEPLIISIDAKSVTYAGSKVVDGQQLQQEIKTYLAKNPQTGAVILNADSKLSYAKIIEVLSEMRAIGGGKVSLAVNKK